SPRPARDRGDAEHAPGEAVGPPPGDRDPGGARQPVLRGARGPTHAAPERTNLCFEALAELPDGRPSAHALAENVQSYLDGDRDLARRRELAAHQLAAARDVLASGHPDARAAAMRRAGRAIALDPESEDAAELVSALLFEPPPEDRM